MFRLIVALSILSLALGFEDRIVNGRRASITELPHQVSLQLYNSHFCGGSILKPNWIVTAAHCLIDIIKKDQVSALSVRAGSSTWNLNGVVKWAEYASIHPGFVRKAMIYDVGLVRVIGNFIYSVAIKPVALPKTLPPLQTPVMASGWGQLSETNNNTPDSLQAVELKFLTQDVCRSPQYGYGTAIMKSMICADGPSKDSCQGDSGGPLVISGTNKLIGVVSWGLGCAKRGFPGIYCDLTDNEVVAYLVKTVPNLY